MKIAWCQDLSPFTELGGAQLTDKAHIIAGIKRGHDIEIILPGTQPVFDEWADLIVVSNATMFPIAMFQNFTKPYVFFIHDYWPACRYRLFYPMLEKCRTCYPSQNWRPIFQKSKLIIWLSPLHRESWLFSFSELEKHAYALIPSPVSPDEFYDMKLERKGVIAVDSGVDFKGKERFVEWCVEHPDMPVTLVGEGSELPPNVTRIEHVPYTKMNELYNRHQVFIHLPVNPMPFDRTVAEASLAGCHIVGNKLVGALSWPEFSQGQEQVKALLRTSSNTFWDKVEGVT